MITVTQEELNKSTKEIEIWYGQNIAGTTIQHPKIGIVNIYNSSCGETRRHIRDKYLCILYHIKELIETGTTNGKIAPPTKIRKDGAIGFMYVYNKIQYGNQILNIIINLLVARDHKKYYMFNFTKNESLNLDPGMFTHCVNLSEGSIKTSNNIIQQKDKNVKTNDVKIGDTFMLGDCIQITVIDILPDYKQLTEQLKHYLED